MKARKFTDLQCDDEVYVDSYGGYHFEIYARHYGRKVSGYRWVYQTGYGWEDFPDAPNYVTNEARRLILKRLKSKNTRFYEYDRDRNQRFTNLRYHDEMSLWLQIRAMSLSIASETPPEATPMFNTTAFFPLGIDPVWGGPVWLPKAIRCPWCDRPKFEPEHPHTTLAYYRAPVAIANECAYCDGSAVCLLDDQFRIVETYFFDEWELREWPLRYEQ